MDVITVLRPENHVERARAAAAPRTRGPFEPSPRSPAFGAFLTAAQRDRPAGAGAISLGSFRELPVAASFPLIFLLCAALCVAVTPLAQTRWGHYRLDRLSLPTEPGAETAMRLLVTPEPDATLLAQSAEAELPAAIRTVSYTNYKVRNGDTVSAIISRFGLRNMGTLLAVNGIDNARRIHSGQTLRIPSMDGIVHTVARGDSLALIAKRYAIPITAILDANDLQASTLVAGQKLFIPGASLSTMDLRRALGELFVYPIKGRLTSRFGYRKDPFTGVRTFHTGIDLAAPTGTAIKATLDGKVATTGYSTVYGNYVIITHESGYQSLYGHMSSISVKRGQQIVQGGLIGRVGNTGYSTGPHLHFSVYKNGKMVDPFTVLK